MKRLIFIVFMIMLSSIVAADKLDIDSVLIEDGEDRLFSGSGSNGHMYVEPDSEIDFEITIENTWDRDSDDALRIEDIILDVVLYEIDDRDDLSYSSSKFDLRAEGYKTIRFDMDIPDDVESDQNYELEISVRGFDEEGGEHTDDMTVDVEVKREAHELEFDEVSLSNPVPCADMARLRLELENNGDNDEDVELRVESYKGLLFEKEFEIEGFDGDNKYDLTRSLDVSGFTPGRYDIEVVLEYGNNELVEKLELKVPECDEIRSDNYDGNDGDSEQSDFDDWEADHDQQRSMNRELFNNLQQESGVEIKYTPTGDVPVLYPEKKSDWGFVALVVANLVLLIAVIVALVMIGTNLFGY
ncbi:hypothetical protein ACFL0V_05980 [Nanoarchaeota archaeon]